MLKVRGSTVVFQDINLLSERYVSMSRPDRPFIERQPSSDFARLTQEFALPPAEVARPEVTINWDKFPPVFKQIAQVLTTQKEVRLTGTGYIKFPEEWTNLQVFGEPWSSIECTYDGHEVVWRRLGG
jgi:hypothetical protein